jgi:hypothetical protein
MALVKVANGFETGWMLGCEGKGLIVGKCLSQLIPSELHGCSPDDVSTWRGKGIVVIEKNVLHDK